MEKNIKDYLHLYLGCEVYSEYYDKIVKFHGVKFYDDTTSGCVLTDFYYNSGKGNFDRLLIQNIKLILRPLSDMTEEEYVEWHTIVVGDARDATRYFIETDGEKTRYLLSKGFDLFGLIEVGLALDKTKLVKQ